MPPTSNDRPQHSPRHWRPFLLVTGLAFLMRLVYLYEAKANPLFAAIIMDARSYWEWSDRLVKGDWIGDTIFYQAPLYPYLLGLFKLLLGPSLWNIKLAQAAIGALSCGIMYLAAARWFPGRGRLIPGMTGLMIALYPPAIFYDSLIQKSGIGLLWMALLLWLLGVCWLPSATASRFRALTPVLLGIVVGLLMLTREETVLLSPLPAICLLLRRPSPGAPAARRFIRPVLYALGLAITLFPVALRNHHVGKEWVVTTSQAGPNFYIGNNPDATGLYSPLRPGRSNTIFERRDAFELAEQALGHKPTPTEVSRYWRTRATGFITSQPGKWLGLLGRKALLLVNAYEVPDAEDMYYFQRDSVVLKGFSLVWHMGVLVPLAAAGVVLTWNRRRELWPLYASLVILAGAVVLFYIMGRYRYTLVPPLILFAAAGLVELLFAVFARRRAALASALAAAVPLAVLCNWPMHNRTAELAGSISNTGAALAESGEDARAIEFYTQALALNPNLPDTVANMGMSQARLGKKVEAAATFGRALQMRPDDPRALFRLGTALAEIGRFDDAIKHLRRALDLAPQDVDTRTNLTALLVQQQRKPELRDLLKDTLARNPADPQAAAELSWLLATASDAELRDPRAALDIIRPLQQRDPASPDLMDILAAAQAATGDFASAIKTQEQAITRAIDPKSGFPPELAAAFRARLELYKSGKPYTE